MLALRLVITMGLVAATASPAAAGDDWTYADQVRANQMSKAINALRDIERNTRTNCYGYGTTYVRPYLGGYAQFVPSASYVPYTPYTTYYRPYLNPFPVNPYFVPPQAYGIFP